ncbi:MAG TPA: hypothetical protein DCM45_00425 [Clostridiales bacterium]|nr:hypothetical protein [Clostridiales bacterium]
MTINEIDLASFGATLLTKQVSNHDVVQIYDWLDGASSPVFSRSEQKFKDITLTILLESSSESETESQFSTLIRALQTCTIAFDGLTKLYDCHFKGKAEPKHLNTCSWLVDIDLLCHKTYLPEAIITANGVCMKSITILGVQPSPCFITVTPTVDIAEFVILGFESDIRLQNLEANKPHVVDGYLYRYLKDGVNDIANLDAFAWPVLPVGTTNLIFSHTTANISIQYYPIFN